MIGKSYEGQWRSWGAAGPREKPQLAGKMQNVRGTEEKRLTRKKNRRKELNMHPANPHNPIAIQANRPRGELLAGCSHALQSDFVDSCPERRITYNVSSIRNTKSHKSQCFKCLDLESRGGRLNSIGNTIAENSTTRFRGGAQNERPPHAIRYQGPQDQSGNHRVPRIGNREARQAHGLRDLSNLRHQLDASTVLAYRVRVVRARCLESGAILRERFQITRIVCDDLQSAEGRWVSEQAKHFAQAANFPRRETQIAAGCSVSAIDRNRRRENLTGGAMKAAWIVGLLVGGLIGWITSGWAVWM